METLRIVLLVLLVLIFAYISYQIQTGKFTINYYTVSSTTPSTVNNSYETNNVTQSNFVELTQNLDDFTGGTRGIHG